MTKEQELLAEEVIEAHKENHGYLDHVFFSLKKQFSNRQFNEVTFLAVIRLLDEKKLLKTFINENETVLTTQGWRTKSICNKRIEKKERINEAGMSLPQSNWYILKMLNLYGIFNK